MTALNWAVWLPDYLERYDPDPLRYLLSINMPESGDSDFSWSEFVRRNNEELVATYGNLVNRVLSFTFRNFDGRRNLSPLRYLLSINMPESGDSDFSWREFVRRAFSMNSENSEMASSMANEAKARILYLRTHED